jgi:DNA-directed RNA polymerase subunit RPC12/RpoP
MPPASAPPPPETEGAEVRYRCPKCRLEVGLLLKSASVSCSRCGRAMKRLAG